MEFVPIVLGIVRRRIRLFLIFFLLLAIGGLAGIYLKRTSYESTAKLLVNLEGLGVSLSQVDIPQIGPQVQAVEAVTSQVELLTSRQLIDQAVDKIGLEGFRSKPPRNRLIRFVVETIGGINRLVTRGLQRVGLIEELSEREAVVEALRASLQVYPVRQSQIIVVGLRWRNPVIPPLALQTLLDLYLERAEAIDIKRSEYGLFTEQVTVAAKALNAAESELREFETRYDVADLVKEKQTLIDRIDRLKAIGAEFGVDEDGLPKAIPGVSVNGGARDVGSVGDQLAELHSRLNALRVDRAKAVTTYTLEHRTVRELDNQIAATEAALNAEKSIVWNTVATSQDRLRTLQAAEHDFNRISRNIDIATQAYQTYRKVAADRAVMLAHETKVRIQVIDPPDTPVRATGPSRLILALAVLAFSIVGAIMAVLLVDAWAGRRRTEPSPAPMG